ncbi:DUF6747 family protein [uncultured Eudoraea sp.]|uniref:DUF6747 family protein n=1 Tax=uncultured Eudoraea sp. TaxID=1035614 RepID=UPI0026065CAC|nr:DUF6747 family protein [uncultured Eudoraea sp.]
MEKILLFREIYVEAFRNWTNMFLKKYFKVFSWFCFALLLITIYAFIFRVATGFAFD